MDFKFYGQATGELRYHIEDRFYPISNDFAINSIYMAELHGVSNEYLRIGLSLIGTLESQVALDFVQEEFGPSIMLIDPGIWDFHFVIKDVTHPDSWDRIK